MSRRSDVGDLMGHDLVMGGKQWTTSWVIIAVYCTTLWMMMWASPKFNQILPLQCSHNPYECRMIMDLSPAYLRG